MTGRLGLLRMRLWSRGSGSGADPRPLPAEDDAIKEAEVLHQLFELDPVKPTDSEFMRRMGVDPNGPFDQVDWYRRALRELRRNGLLQPEDEVVALSLAALHFADLFELS